MRRRLAVVVSHPIQYHSPWFRQLSKRMELTVLYMHRQDASGQALAGFDVEFEWDIDLLEGYSFRWLENVARRPGASAFSAFDTPQVFDIIRYGRFDAVLVFGWYQKSSLQTLAACWRYGVPVIMRGDSQLNTQRPWWKTCVKTPAYRWFLPRLNAHLYTGVRNRVYLEHYGVPHERLFFAPHFVDNEFFRARAEAAVDTARHVAVRKELGIPQEAFVVLFVGKLVAKKRPSDFVQACLRILASAQEVDLHAILVGDGPLRGELEAESRAADGRIHFAGFRNQSEVPVWYRAADVLVLPSDGRETWGLVVNEAMACGIPVIVSDAAGCAPDLIEDDRNGKIYPMGDVEALVRAILRLRVLCKSRLNAVQSAVTERIRHYSIDKATAGLETALAAVCRRERAA